MAELWRTCISCFRGGDAYLGKRRERHSTCLLPHIRKEGGGIISYGHCHISGKRDMPNILLYGKTQVWRRGGRRRGGDGILNTLMGLRVPLMGGGRRWAGRGGMFMGGKQQLTTYGREEEHIVQILENIYASRHITVDV